MPDKPKCDTCKFFQYPTDMEGRCHRFPPQFIKEFEKWKGGSDTKKIHAFDFPRVAKESWCGEWIYKTE